MSPSEAEFDAFYQAQYPRLVAMAYALVGDLGDAQDLAQEAFCRAWPRWSSIARYENPGAWTRRVDFVSLAGEGSPGGWTFVDRTLTISLSPTGGGTQFQSVWTWNGTNFQR